MPDLKISFFIFNQGAGGEQSVTVYYLLWVKVHELKVFLQWLIKGIFATAP